MIRYYFVKAFFWGCISLFDFDSGKKLTEGDFKKIIQHMAKDLSEKEGDIKVLKDQYSKVNEELKVFKSLNEEKKQPEVVQLFMRNGFDLKTSRNIADIVQRELTISTLQSQQAAPEQQQAEAPAQQPAQQPAQESAPATPPAQPVAPETRPPSQPPKG